MNRIRLTQQEADPIGGIVVDRQSQAARTLALAHVDGRVRLVLHDLLLHRIDERLNVPFVDPVHVFPWNGTAPGGRMPSR